MAIGNERPARIRLEAPSGKLEADLRAAQAKLRKFENATKRGRGRGSKSTGAQLLSAARVGTGALEKAGSSLFDAFAGGVEGAVDLERGLTRFQIAGNISAQAMFEMRNSLIAVASATGITRSELLAGAASYLAITGDADGARNSVALFAKVANASGASMADVANTAASLRENLKIDPKDFEGAFSALIVQGKAGAIELRDLSQELSGVAPQFAQFAKGSGLAGLATMGAALQAGRKGFASASEAATGLRALIVAINRNAARFKSGGVRVFDRDARTGKKTLRGFREIIDDIAKSRLAKDPTLLTKAFGSDEAKRFYDQLVLNRDLLDELERKSADGGAVSTDALAYQQSAAGKLEQAMEKLKISIASAFTPERIQDFAAALQSIAAAAKQVADAFNAVFEFNEVRKKKNRNEAELVKLGEYTGEDPQLLRQSQINAKRIALQEAAARPALRAARAQRVLEDVGAGDLQLRPGGFGQSVAAPPPSFSPAPRAAAAPVLGLSTPAINVSLWLDSERIATTQQNARSHRRQPGGR